VLNIAIGETHAQVWPGPGHDEFWRFLAHTVE
jgi:hypothetical protein